MKKQLSNDEARLDMVVDVKTTMALARLAKHQKTTPRELLERVIRALDDEVVVQLQPDTPEWDTYFGITKLPADFFKVK